METREFEIDVERRSEPAGIALLGEPPAPVTLDAGAAIRDWSDGPRTSAQRLIETSGEPDEVTPTRLVWFERVWPWKRTTLTDEPVRHEFPQPHDDFLEQTIDFPVPSGRVGELARYDGSVIVDRTKGEVSVRCDGPSMNFLAINLAVEIIEGRLDADEARSRHAAIFERHREGDEDPLTHGFAFDASDAETGDQDAPVRA